MPVTAVKSRWIGGELYFYDAAGQVIARLGAGGFSSTKVVNMAAATQALTAEQSGQAFVGAEDAVFTLPAAGAATKGVWYSFICGALSTGVGLSASPAAADAVVGNGLTAVVDKDLINTGATDRLGDSVTLLCDGVQWVITSVIGTWAKQA